MPKTAAPSPLAALLARPTSKGPLCTVSIVARRLTAQDRTDLATAMGRADITGRDIASTLDGMGHRVASNTVNRHRRKECSCWTRPDGWQEGHKE